MKKNQNKEQVLAVVTLSAIFGKLNFISTDSFSISNYVI